MKYVKNGWMITQRGARCGNRSRMGVRSLMLAGALLACVSCAGATGEGEATSSHQDHPASSAGVSGDAVTAGSSAEPSGVDRFGLPRGRFVGSVTSPDGRTVGTLNTAHLDRWRTDGGAAIAQRLPDIVECVGPQGAPLRATRDEYLASVAPSDATTFDGAAYCDGSPMGGVSWTYGSDGVGTVIVEGERGSVNDRGYVLDSDGRRVDGLRITEDGQLVRP